MANRIFGSAAQTQRSDIAIVLHRKENGTPVGAFHISPDDENYNSVLKHIGDGQTPRGKMAEEQVRQCLSTGKVLRFRIRS